MLIVTNLNIVKLKISLKLTVSRIFRERFKSIQVVDISMVKRTTILLEEDLYEYLIKESIRKYGSSKKLSQVINELLRKTLYDKEKVIQLLSEERVAHTTAKKFEEFRRELSRRMEE